MQSLHVFRVLACAGAMGLAATTLAQTPSSPADDWVVVGESGGRVVQIATSPVEAAHVVASVGRAGDRPVQVGPHHSTDAGANWQPVSIGAAYDIPPDAGVAFGGDGSLYVVDGDGLRIRAAGSSVWNRVTLVPTGYAPVRQPVIETGSLPGAPVWTVTDATAVAARKVHVWDPDTYTLTSAALPAEVHDGHFRALAVAPEAAGSAVVAVAPSSFAAPGSPWSLWLTSNRGSSWTRINTVGLPATDYSRVRMIGASLYVAASGPDGGLYRSNNWGYSWEALHGLDWAGTPVYDVLADAGHPDMLWAATGQGVALSVDAGSSWQLGVDGTQGQAVRALAQAADGTVFAGVEAQGVFARAPGESGFAPRNFQFNGHPAMAVAGNPLSADHVALMQISEPAYETWVRRLSETTDGGQSWVGDSSWSDVHDFQSLAFGADGSLWVAYSDEHELDTKLLRRHPNGSSQTFLPVAELESFPGRAREIAAILTSPVDPELVLLLEQESEFNPSHRRRIWRSDDGGETWSVRFSRLRSEIEPVGLFPVFDAAGQQFVMIHRGPQGQTGLLRSVDGGVSWSEEAMPAVGQDRAMLACTAGAAVGAPTLYALIWQPGTSTYYLVRSDDGAASWAATGWQTPIAIDSWSRSLGCDDTDPDTVWLARESSRVFRSQDGGESFVDVRDGARGPGRANAFMVHGGFEWLATQQGTYTWLEATAAPQLAATVSGARMRPRVTLTWEGGQGEMTVLRNDQPIFTGAGSGTYSQTVRITDLPARYQVCPSAGGTCSNTVEIPAP